MKRIKMLGVHGVHDKHQPLRSAELAKARAGHVLFEFAVPPLQGVTGDSAGSHARSPPS